MALTYTSEKLSLDSAQRFKDSFLAAGQMGSSGFSSSHPSTDTTPAIQYVFIGNHIPYANEASPDSIVQTDATERDVWDNMFGAKRVTANDVELVVPRVNWTANTKYRQYDDTISLTDSITGNTTQNLKPMYVITTDRNVYKCLSNNYSANSTVEPVGDYSTSNGAISTADGYIWKYLFNVKSSNKFLNNEWLPTPTRSTTSSTQTDYGLDDTGVVEGELTTVVVQTGGSGYYDTSIAVTAFSTGCTVLTVANTANIAANMSVSGTGIPTGSFISTLDTPNNKITLSSSTTSNGGGAGSNLSIFTRVYFDGDGIDASGTATVSNGSISKITLSTIGTGYSRCNVKIYGTGTNANARAIIAPKYGHAKNPIHDVLAKNIMISTRIGEVDSTEGGVISVDTSFRQFGLLRNPHKYGIATSANNMTANLVVSQTRTLTLTTGTTYTLDEYVYQGSSVDSATAYGFIHSQTPTTVSLTKVRGTFVTGLSLIGVTSGVARTIVSQVTPEFEPYSGDILYVENAAKVDREDGQAENIKFVIQF